MRHILSIFAAIAVAATVRGAELPAMSDTTRAPIDQRSIVGVLPVTGGVDVYWQHLNELATPYRPRLMMTPLNADGSLRGPIRILRQDEMMMSTSVSASAAGPIALWRGGSSGLDALFASKVVDGELKSPEGKLVTGSGEAPAVACSTSHCFALWSGAGAVYAAELDPSGNVIGPSISLPYSYGLFKVEDSGIFMIGTSGTQRRATLIDFNGTVKYDTTIELAVASDSAARIAVDYDGTQHVIAWAEVPLDGSRPPRTAIRALTVSDKGEPSRPVTILDVAAYGAGADWVQIGWNGSTHLLVARTVTAPGLGSALLTCVFDRNLTQVTQPFLNGRMLVPQGVEEYGSQWLVWGDDFPGGSPHPTVLFVSSEGVQLHAAQVDDAQVERRRATRR